MTNNGPVGGCKKCGETAVFQHRPNCSEARHTPGPWTLSSVTLYADRGEGPESGYIIAGQRGLPGFRSESYSRPVPERVRKDAQLIAAAPELLKVLETVIERLEAWQEGERHAQMAAETRQDRPSAEIHYNTVKNYASLVWLGKAAIAKATA